ncbi:hypothetical protein KCU91_g16506, partial [Aureobasidium melanogenum]
AAGIPTWSPTVVLICRSTAYVWQSGRDAQFSADCGPTLLSPSASPNSDYTSQTQIFDGLNHISTNVCLRLSFKHGPFWRPSSGVVNTDGH